MAQPTHEWRPPERPWQEQDLYDLPEDGSRYEIIDGSLHVTPPPGTGINFWPTRSDRRSRPLRRPVGGSFGRPDFGRLSPISFRTSPC